MRKLTVFLLTTVLCLSFVTLPAAAAAADVSANDKQSQAAAVLNMMGALQGDGTGNLDLSGTLTRAQFCKIAVVVMGLSKNVSLYSGYTIFPDVPSSSWASGYVNLAVRSASVISGYPDGTFGPDDTVTYGQAVTVLMRMLGYASTDVGSQWPDNYIEKANEIGLTDGVDRSGSEAITRGDMAVLFLNLLNTPLNGSTSAYMTKISGATVVDGVFLVSGNASTDSGLTGCVEITGAASGVYVPVNKAPTALTGSYGALILNSGGKALTFVPAANGTTVVSTVTSTTATTIECASGAKISMSSSPSFYFDGTSSTYSEKWVDIQGGMLVSAHYSDGGAIECVMVATPDSDNSNVTVVTSTSYSLPSSDTIYKDGVAVDSSEISKYDVISEESDYGVYNVSSKRITARYESASPDVQAPSTVTVLGVEFSVLPSAVSSFSGFKIGDTITLLLTTDNKVARALSTSEYSDINIGVVKTVSGSTVTVGLDNGITVSGTASNTNFSNLSGTLVSVSSSKAGYLNITRLGTQTVTTPLNITSLTFGTEKVSKSAKIYDFVTNQSTNSTAKQIDLDDITVSSVAGSAVKYVGYDASGKVNFLLLNNVTGDVYTYGILDCETVSGGSGTMTYSNPGVAVVNGDGTTVYAINSAGLMDGTVAGIAWSGDGVLVSCVTLTKADGVSRSAFTEDASGKWYVTANGVRYPVSDDVQAYNVSTGTWTTLSKARAFSENLTVYYDRSPSLGGKIRIVMANG